MPIVLAPLSHGHPPNPPPPPPPPPVAVGKEGEWLRHRTLFEVNSNWNGKQGLSTGIRPKINGGGKGEGRGELVYGWCGDCASGRGCRGLREGEARNLIGRHGLTPVRASVREGKRGVIDGVASNRLGAAAIGEAPPPMAA